MAEKSDFEYCVGTVADTKILRYNFPFDELTTQQKNLLYCLYKASLYGRDIVYDQIFRYGLYIRQVLELILQVHLYVEPPSIMTEESEWPLFMEFLQLYWLNNGIFHHMSGEKLQPRFSQEYFIRLMNCTIMPTPPAGCNLLDILFGDSYPKKTVPNSVEGSSVNFYFGLTTEEILAYHRELDKKSDDVTEPDEHGLNSQLVKNADGTIEERRWFIGGMYGQALQRCVEWLEAALPYAENPEQLQAFECLIKYYKSGNLQDFIAYCKAWVKDTKSTVDLIHGFIETYDDPFGFRGTYEAVLTVIDPVASRRIKFLQDNAQWFEDHSPVLPQHRRPVAHGIDARVVHVVVEAGDAAPNTPIGINLPNAQWFRSKYGSKSISMDNIVYSYDQVSKQYRVGSEFYLPEQYTRMQKVSDLAHAIMVDMHEVLGHGSGQMEPGVGDPGTAIGGVYAILEEARADLFACYYIMDPYVVEIGLLPDLEAGRALYDMEITNGLMLQLTRIPFEKNTLNEAHMRDRQLIAGWVFERGSADGSIVRTKRAGKTYFEIRNYDRCRVLFGELLCEIQRIKSQGDRTAANALVERYGTHIDKELHREVLDRYGKFKVAPFSGFIQPELARDNGVVTVSYPKDFVGQMLHYSKVYGTLPTEN